MGHQQVERFEKVVLAHLDDAYTLARYLLKDEHDAQDVVQDASLRAFRHFDGFRDGDARAWFLSIVRNCCFTWQRRHRNDRLSIPLDEHSTSHAGASAPADALAIARSEREALQRAVAQLPLEFREVIVLREVEEMSYTQIATVTGAPIGTVMSRLSRARQRLATALRAGVRETG